MRILAVSQYYWPEPFNVAEICEELQSRGHEVTVLTGLPNYPEGELYPGYDSRRDMEEERNGVRVIRVADRPRHTGAVNRTINYYSFAERGKARARMLKERYDVVVAFTISPVMSAAPANEYCRKNGVPLLNYVIDLWPECLLAGGVKRGSLIYRHYKRTSRRIYGCADAYAITSPSFEGYLSDLLGSEIFATYLPQFAENMFAGGQRQEVPEGYDRKRLNLTFAGNVGSAQSVETLVIAASILGNDPRLLFHVVGDGSELARCKELAARLGASNVTFHGRHDIAEMPSYYGASDAMVATFADMPTLSLTLPRKIQSYMAAGRPVIAAAGGETERVVKDAACGLTSPAEDAEALARACFDFAAMPEVERSEMGARARAYYEEHYSRETFFATLEGCLERTACLRHGACFST